MSHRHSPEIGSGVHVEPSLKNGHETKNKKLEAFLTLTRDYFAENPKELQNIKDLVEKTAFKNGSLAKNLSGFRQSFENNLPTIVKNNKEYKKITKGLPDAEFAKTVGEIVKVWVAMQEAGENQEGVEVENTSPTEEAPQTEPIAESKAEEPVKEEVRLAESKNSEIVNQTVEKSKKFLEAVVPEFEKNPVGFTLQKPEEFEVLAKSFGIPVSQAVKALFFHYGHMDKYNSLFKEVRPTKLQKTKELAMLRHLVNLIQPERNKEGIINIAEEDSVAENEDRLLNVKDVSELEPQTREKEGLPFTIYTTARRERILQTEVVDNNGVKRRIKIKLPKNFGVLEDEKLYRILQGLVNSNKLDLRFFRGNIITNKKILDKNSKIFENEWKKILSSIPNKVILPNRELGPAGKSVSTEEIKESGVVSPESNEAFVESGKEELSMDLRLENFPDITEEEVMELEQNEYYKALKEQAWDEYKDDLGDFSKMSPKNKRNVENAFYYEWEARLPLIKHFIQNREK